MRRKVEAAELEGPTNEPWKVPPMSLSEGKCTRLSVTCLRFVHGCSRKKEGLSPKESALDGFAHVPVQNETALAQAVSQHPVAVAVCCGDYIDNWHAYTGGIFNIPGTGTVTALCCTCILGRLSFVCTAPSQRVYSILGSRAVT
jgi:hypothetical protein